MQTAIDSKVAGIAVTLAKPDAMAPAVAAAVSGGNPGGGIQLRVRQVRAAGDLRSISARTRSWPASRPRQAAHPEGAKKVLCVIQEQGSGGAGSPAAPASRPGFTGGSTENLNVNSKDMPSVEATITRQAAAGPQHRPRRRAGCADRADGGASRKATPAATPRSSPSTPTPSWSTPIKSGDVQWAIDQQPYLQGYLAVDSLWLYLNNRTPSAAASRR